MKHTTASIVSFACIACAAVASAASTPDPVDPFMGEYAGTYVPGPGQHGVAARAFVIPEKREGQPFSYRVVVKAGEARFELRGPPKDGAVELKGEPWTGTLADGNLRASAGEATVDLTFTVRRSPTEGAKPPEGATVLLPLEPGTPPPLAAWTNKHWKRLTDGSMQVRHGSTQTVQRFGAMKLHLEFRTPYEPHRFGQGRGNSGVYVLGRYEIQVLESFGLEGSEGHAGGIYATAKPAIDYAALPPLQWQTYDMTIYPARIDFNGTVLQPPVITVLHNGIPIHQNRELPKPTPGASGRGHGVRGPIFLQDHGNRVCYRNIWVEEIEDPRPWPPGHPRPVEEQLKPFDAALAAVRRFEEKGSKKALDTVRRLTAQTEDYPDFKKPVERRFLKFLRSDLSLAAKRFVCENLRLVASQRALKLLVPMLTDQATFGMALVAMEPIKSRSVDGILLKQLSTVRGEARIQVIGVLGRRGDGRSVPPLAELLEDTDAGTAFAAATALGTIGTARAARALRAAMGRTSGKLRDSVCTGYLSCATKLAARDKNARAFSMCREVYNADVGVPVRQAALRGMVAADEKKAGKLIVRIVRGDDAAMRSVAVSLIDQLSDPAHVAAVTGRIDALPAADQVALLNALARREDTLGTPTAVAATSSDHEGVRIAALNAMARLGDASHVELLAARAAKAADEERQAALQCLARMRGPEGMRRYEINQVIRAGLEDAAPPVKAVLISACGMRRIREAVPVLLKATASSHAGVRAASYGAIQRLADQRHMPALVTLVLTAPEAADRANAEKALVGVGRRVRNEKQRGKAVRDALLQIKDPLRRSLLIRILGTLGDKTSLALFRESLKHEAGEVRLAAIGALAAWDSADVAPDLLAVAAGDQAPACRIAAVRGYVRLAVLPAKRPMPATVTMLTKVVETAKTPRERKAAYTALAAHPTPATLRAAEFYANAAVANGEARAAAATIKAALLKRKFKATASHNGKAARNAIDANVRTSWSTGAPMSPGAWLMIDMSSVLTVKGLTLDAGPAKKGYPRKYEVYVSQDGKAWGQPLLSGTAEQSPTVLAFGKAVSARYVKIVQTGSDKRNAWVIHDIRVQY